MFVRDTQPTVLSQEGLLGLCASLNRPVVDIEDLPVGPARAAIALHRGAPGDSCLAVVVRSIESGVICTFTYRGEPSRPVQEAMDIGLSFAESMGFLFDVDMIRADGGAASGLEAIDAAAGTTRDRGAAHAHAFWCELVGEDGPPAATQEPSEEPPSAPPAAAPEAPPLSKFRGDGDPELLLEAEVLEDASPAQLGRIPIVRRRMRDEAASGPSFATRLRASF